MPNNLKRFSIQSFITFLLLLSSGNLFAQTPETSTTTNTTETAQTTPAETNIKQPEKPIYTSATARDDALLANAKPRESKWLETPNEKFIALFKANETRKTKGTLLILHAPESPQLWPAPLEDLRRNLPLYGWQTMTTPLPQKYPENPPERDNSNQTSSATAIQPTDTAASSITASADANTPAQSAAASSEATKPILPRAQRIAERITAAITELNKNGQFNIILLVDNSSAPESLAGIFKKTDAGTIDKNTINESIQAILLINLQDQEALTAEQLEAIFTSSNLPFLDVFFQPDNQYQTDMRRLHRAEAMRNNIKDYSQLTLPPQHAISVNDEQSFWLEKVRGFMEKKAKGMEIKK